MRAPQVATPVPVTPPRLLLVMLVAGVVIRTVWRSYRSSRAAREMSSSKSGQSNFLFGDGKLNGVQRRGAHALAHV